MTRRYSGLIGLFQVLSYLEPGYPRASRQRVAQIEHQCWPRLDDKKTPVKSDEDNLGEEFRAGREDYALLDRVDRVAISRRLSTIYDAETLS